MANEVEAKTLGDYVRQARVAKGLSLRDLASRLELAPSYISDIENDRRVPAEGVLRNLTTELDLDFDQLMAFAGRFGDLADRYLRRNPTAGRLFRRISQADLSEEEVAKLLNEADEMARKREKGQ